MELVPAKGKRGWTKLELQKVERYVLIFGWGQWARVLHSAFKGKKIRLSERDMENMCRTIVSPLQPVVYSICSCYRSTQACMHTHTRAHIHTRTHTRDVHTLVLLLPQLVYCLHHFKGDEKARPFIHKLIDPSEPGPGKPDGEGRTRSGGCAPQHCTLPLVLLVFFACTHVTAARDCCTLMCPCYNLKLLHLCCLALQFFLIASVTPSISFTDSSLHTSCLSARSSSSSLPLSSVATLQSNPFAFTEDDYLALIAKDSESLFQDEMYMKHLRKHANRIVLRVRQLHIIRWQILGDNLQNIRQGVPAK